MDRKLKRIIGFTLIEMLLVIAVIAALFYMGVNYMQQRLQQERIDKMVLQMQQILSASLNYFLVNNKWPVTTYGGAWTSVTALQTAGLLPAGNIGNPFLMQDTPDAFSLGTDTQGTRLVVYAYVGKTPQAVPIAKVIASKLPMARECESYTTATATCTPCTTANANCYVTASVGVPGQNLNNATAINYAGLFHSGACVKGPTCPLSSMQPMITVVPVAIAGITEAPTCTDPNDISTCTINTYPITNFIGYATGPTTLASDGAQPNLPTCIGGNGICLLKNDGTRISGKKGDVYWRVCIGVDTSGGKVASPTNNKAWGQLMGTVMVLTRCAPGTENDKNSEFNVYMAN